MYGKEVAYVALVAADVEAAAGMFEKDYGLHRSDKLFDGRSVPMLSVGQTALALFAPGDPYIGGSKFTGVHHVALAVDDLDNAVNDIKKRGVSFETEKAEKSLDDGKRFLLSLQATNGIRTYVTTKVDREPAKKGFIEHIDHLGIMGTNNPICLDTYCARLGCELTGEQVKLIVPHQVNQRIIDSAMEKLGFGPEKAFVNIDKYGNTSAASIPIALDEAVRAGKVEKGDAVILVAFGGGLTWANAVVRM